MKNEEEVMLIQMVVKMSKALASLEISHFSHGWDEHEEEREYFEKWLNSENFPEEE